MLEDARNCGGTSQTWRKNGSHALSHDINDYKCLGFSGVLISASRSATQPHPVVCCGPMVGLLTTQSK